MKNTGLARHSDVAKGRNETITSGRENQMANIGLDDITYLKDAAESPKEMAAIRKEFADLKLEMSKLKTHFSTTHHD